MKSETLSMKKARVLLARRPTLRYSSELSLSSVDGHLTHIYSVRGSGESISAQVTGARVLCADKTLLGCFGTPVMPRNSDLSAHLSCYSVCNLVFGLVPILLVMLTLTLRPLDMYVVGSGAGHIHGADRLSLSVVLVLSDLMLLFNCIVTPLAQETGARAPSADITSMTWHLRHCVIRDAFDLSICVFAYCFMVSYYLIICGCLVTILAQETGARAPSADNVLTISYDPLLFDCVVTILAQETGARALSADNTPTVPMLVSTMVWSQWHYEIRGISDLFTCLFVYCSVLSYYLLLLDCSVTILAQETGARAPYADNTPTIPYDTLLFDCVVTILAQETDARALSADNTPTVPMLVSTMVWSRWHYEIRGISDLITCLFVFRSVLSYYLLLLDCVVTIVAQETGARAPCADNTPTGWCACCWLPPLSCDSGRRTGWRRLEAVNKIVLICVLFIDTYVLGRLGPSLLSRCCSSGPTLLGPSAWARFSIWCIVQHMSGSGPTLLGPSAWARFSIWCIAQPISGSVGVDLVSSMLFCDMRYMGTKYYEFRVLQVHHDCNDTSVPADLFCSVSSLPDG